MLVISSSLKLSVKEIRDSISLNPSIFNKSIIGYVTTNIGSS